ncbi:ABC transporter ATP-binding protein [Paenibacillus sp. CAU 1782]
MQSGNKSHLLMTMGIPQEEIIYELLCDRTIEGGFGDTLLVLSKKGLSIAYCQLEPTGEKRFCGFPVKQGKRRLKWPLPKGGKGISDERTSNSRSSHMKQTGDKMSAGRQSNEQHAEDQTSASRSSHEKLAEDRTSASQPYHEQQAVDETSGSRTSVGYKAGVQSGNNQSADKDSSNDWCIEHIPMEELEGLSIVNLVASGMIVAKGKEDRAIAAFTNGLMSRASLLVKLLQKVKNGESIEEDLLTHDDAEESCPSCGMIYPEPGRRICPKCMKRSAVFVRLLKFAVPYKKTVAIVIFLMLLNAVCSLIIPYLMGTVLFDQALAGKGNFAGQIGLVIGLIILFRSLSLLFGILYGVMNARMAVNVVFDLKSAIFSSMQRLSLSFFQRRQTGHLMTRVNNDSGDLQAFFIDGLSYFIVNAMNIIGIAVILLMLDWKLTLLCFLPLPVVILLVRSAFPKLWRMSWRSHRRVASLNSLISDSIRGTRVVKAFGMEQKEMERFHYANQNYSGAEQRYSKLSGTVFPVLNVLTQLGGMMIWAFGGWMILRGEMAFGLLLTFVHYMYMLYGPIEFMNNIVSWWSYCMSAAQRIFEIQDAVPEIEDKKDAIHLSKLKGDIELDNVTFGYEPNKPILKGINLKVKEGEMLGVVGHSGAGKSTLVNVISRLYEVNEGAVRFGGIDVKDLSSASLRNHIGIVSQEIYVFSGSIAENIAYVNPDCRMEEIIYASKIAGAHDFIEKLPDGYDTIVGTGGYDLSGGEKQRLSIARAVLYNPRLLILDEATASLDTETELKIQEALEKLIRGRTTIAIAHRLSTLRNADYLVVVEDGRIVEEGTHSALLEKDGAYAGLVKKHDEALKMNEVIIA